MTQHNHPDNQPTRLSRGRRMDDYRKNIEIHPIHLILLGAGMTLMTGMIGYLAKSWADNITTELKNFRVSVENIAIKNASRDAWQDEMTRWRDTTDRRITDVEHSIPYHPSQPDKRYRGGQP